MSGADEEARESVTENKWREVADAEDVEGDYDDPHNLSNEKLLERVAELDSETYPVSKRARAALDQLEESEA